MKTTCHEKVEWGSEKGISAENLVQEYLWTVHPANVIMSPCQQSGERRHVDVVFPVQ